MTVYGTPDPYTTSEAHATDDELASNIAANRGLPIGLPGAVAAARFVGATTSGAPTTGTFAKGDYIVDQTGTMWACTVAGSPGTWVDISSGRELAYAESSTQQTSIGTSFVDLTGLSITFTVRSRPVMVESFHPAVLSTIGVASSALLAFRDESNVDKKWALQNLPTANAFYIMTNRERINTPGTYTRKASLGRNGGSGTLTHGSNGSDAKYMAFIRAVEQ